MRPQIMMNQRAISGGTETNVTTANGESTGYTMNGDTRTLATTAYGKSTSHNLNGDKENIATTADGESMGDNLKGDMESNGTTARVESKSDKMNIDTETIATTPYGKSPSDKINVDTQTIANTARKSDINELKGWGYRHQQCLILFCCLTTAYSMRSCMSVALVAMVDKGQNLGSLSNNTLNETNLHLNAYNRTSLNTQNNVFVHSLLLSSPYPTFQWSKKTQDLILSSFSWGYMVLQIPSGQLAHFFGARYMLTGALAINCVVMFSLPWAAHYGGWALTIIFRIIQGLSQACVMPGMHTVLGKWTHIEERGRLAGWAYGGQALGTVLGLPISGFICASSLGWPGVFRFFGILSGIVAAVLWCFGADTPAKHRKISAEEKAYIENNTGSGSGKKQPPVPWGHILRCRGMYAIVIAHIGQTWGQITLYAEVPAYMDKVMGVNIKANGVLSAFPFLVMWITSFFFSWLTDRLIVKKILSVTHARKLANSLGSIPAALGLMVLAYAPKNIYAVESILVFICAFKIAGHVGYNVNHIDISNNYSGTMMSISNFVSNSVGSLAPIVAGFILTDVTSEFLWRQVFFIAAAIYFITNTVYIILGTSERAEWDKIHEIREDAEDPQEMEELIKK